jgi:hypothetical protein
MDYARVQKRAADLGAVIGAEDGVGAPVGFVERRSGHESANKHFVQGRLPVADITSDIADRIRSRL